MEGAAAGVGNEVDDAAGGVAAVDGGAGAAEHFDALRAEEGEILQERCGVALRGAGIAEAEAVDGDGGVLAGGGRG